MNEPLGFILVLLEQLSCCTKTSIHCYKSHSLYCGNMILQCVNNPGDDQQYCVSMILIKGNLEKLLDYWYDMNLCLDCQNILRFVDGYNLITQAIQTLHSF